MRTYHATVYTNDGQHRMLQSVGIELEQSIALRVVRDLNTLLSILGANAYAELTKEDQ